MILGSFWKLALSLFLCSSSLVFIKRDLIKVGIVLQ